jgi:hypothetical protein
MGVFIVNLKSPEYTAAGKQHGAIYLGHACFNTYIVVVQVSVWL